MAKIGISRSKVLLAIGAIAAVLLATLAIIDIALLAPQRLAKRQQLKRNEPSELVRPSELREGQTRDVITAFRIEEWRLPAKDREGDPADTYLKGYMAWQAGEKFADEGDLKRARGRYEVATTTFAAIHEKWPDFEPDMVEFRSRKIAEALDRLDHQEGGDPKPPPPAGGRGAGADAGNPADVYLTGYLMVRQAEQLAAEGDPEGAKEELESAARIFDTISTRWPGFEPEMIRFRSVKIEAALARIHTQREREILAGEPFTDPDP